MDDQPQAEGSIAGRRETAAGSASDVMDPSRRGHRRGLGVGVVALRMTTFRHRLKAWAIAESV
jgi:hypothetical protein